MQKLYMTLRGFSRKVQASDLYRLLPERGLAPCADQAQAGRLIWEPYSPVG
jgi:hypothetical protein